MRKLHKGLLIGGITMAVLVPAGFVAASQIDNGHGNGNGLMNHDGTGVQTQDRIQLRDATGVQTQDRIQARDGTGTNHVANSAPATVTGNGALNHTGPADGTGNQFRSGR